MNVITILWCYRYFWSLHRSYHYKTTLFLGAEQIAACHCALPAQWQVAHANRQNTKNKEKNIIEHNQIHISQRSHFCSFGRIKFSNSLWLNISTKPLRRHQWIPLFWSPLQTVLYFTLGSKNSKIKLSVPIYAITLERDHTSGHSRGDVILVDKIFELWV